jgi:hypothetical protein
MMEAPLAGVCLALLHSFAPCLLVLYMIGTQEIMYCAFAHGLACHHVKEESICVS